MKQTHTYKCDVCGKEFSDQNDERAKQKALDCEETHEYIYIKLLDSDVQRLWAYIVTGEDDLLTETLIDELRKYRKLV